VSGKTLFALLVLVFIVLAPFTVLPALLESATARLLQDQLGLEEAPEVEIESTPAPMMYVGSFSRALISAKGIEIAGVKTSNIIMDLDPFNLNIMESATNGEVSTEQPLSGNLSVALSEDNVSRLAQVGSGVPVQDVQLEDDLVVLGMSLGFGAPVTVRGRLSLQNGLLIFQPEQVEGAPAFVSSEQLLALTRFSYPLTDLPFGARATGVKVRKGSLILTGYMQEIPLSGIPAS
jgi:LmeA-like phospholipid-binding